MFENLIEITRLVNIDFRIGGFAYFVCAETFGNMWDFYDFVFRWFSNNDNISETIIVIQSTLILRLFAF